MYYAHPQPYRPRHADRAVDQDAPSRADGWARPLPVDPHGRTPYSPSYTGTHRLIGPVR